MTLSQSICCHVYLLMMAARPGNPLHCGRRRRRQATAAALLSHALQSWLANGHAVKSTTPALSLRCIVLFAHEHLDALNSTQTLYSFLARQLFAHPKTRYRPVHRLHLSTITTRAFANAALAFCLLSANSPPHTCL